MAQPQGQETERVESPFARRAGATPVPVVTSETDSETEVIAVDEPSSPASVKVRRLGVHPPRRLDGLRPMTGYEEELVEDAAFRSNTAALCNEVLARCLCKVGESIADAGARVGGLLVAERDVAIVDLRRLTFWGSRGNEGALPGVRSRESHRLRSHAGRHRGG